VFGTNEFARPDVVVFVLDGNVVLGRGTVADLGVYPAAAWMYPGWWTVQNNVAPTANLMGNLMGNTLGTSWGTHWEHIKPIGEILRTY